MTILSSFARDWARWSLAERRAALVFALVAVIGPAAHFLT
jgi:hypothetical protein